ncbi:hypothetical protein NB069_08775 [Leclercia adecarboxylata]|uniref:hypothetical protein n=1 Tax=Leclercia adecarboxylata TaxID=83655 RepID=UPI00202A3AA2|nr:hypothetical protein [Leclercia adecarboxylata]URO00942.1 hypothetical protein NB069_08775 [Leclercia adecarboxylata]
MAQSNIDMFDEITGRVFADLYNNFPCFYFLRPEDYTVPIENSNDFVKDIIKEEASLSFVADSFYWLVESGFISGKKMADGSIKGAVLTAKGLECLKKTPDSLHPSNGTQLTEAVKSGSASAVKIIANQILATGVTLALNKMGMA